MWQRPKDLKNILISRLLKENPFNKQNREENQEIIIKEKRVFQSIRSKGKQNNVNLQKAETAKRQKETKKSKEISGN